LLKYPRQPPHFLPLPPTTHSVLINTHSTSSHFHPHFYIYLHVNFYNSKRKQASQSLIFVMPSLSSSFASYRRRVCATSDHPPAKKDFGMGSLDDYPLSLASKTSTPSPLGSGSVHSTANRMVLERKRKFMVELEAGLDAAITDTIAPPPQGKIHPSEVIGTMPNLHYGSLPTADIETTPSQKDIRRAVGLPTLDRFETEAGNLFLSYISAYESTLVDEVTVYPEGRVKETPHVGPTKAEYKYALLQTSPPFSPLSAYSIDRPYLLHL
jgi:hypothetical protein